MNINVLSQYKVNMYAFLLLSFFLVSVFASTEEFTNYRVEEDDDRIRSNFTVNDKNEMITNKNETDSKITDDMELDDFLRFMGFMAIHG